MSIKVSVVVPVYNTGDDIERNIASMLGQTLSCDEFEVIYVDDGSTDATPARLEAVAAEHANVTVIRLPHSGGPGAPRNVGIDRARGEYVQFLDDDDWMAPDSLRRLYEFGAANAADIVMGETVSNFQWTPFSLFRESRGNCSVLDSDIVLSMLVNKMCRRVFLKEQGLRFPDQGGTEEDLLFVANAFCATDRVAVMSEHACYYYWRRGSGTHRSATPFDPAQWIARYTEVTDVFLSRLAPGPERERVIGNYALLNIHSPLSAMADQTGGDGEFAARYEAARTAIRRRTPLVLGAASGVLLRVASMLLARGDRRRLVDWYRSMNAIVPDMSVAHSGWHAPGVLEMGFTARLVIGEARAPLPFSCSNGRVFLDPSLATRFGVPPECLDVTEELNEGIIELFTEDQRDCSRMHHCTAAERELVPLGDDRFEIRFRCTGWIDAKGARGGLRNLRTYLSAFGIERSIGARRAAG